METGTGFPVKANFVGIKLIWATRSLTLSLVGNIQATDNADETSSIGANRWFRKDFETVTLSRYWVVSVHEARLRVFHQAELDRQRRYQVELARYQAELSSEQTTRHRASPRHQREHTPAQVFARVSGVALGFRGQLGANLFG